jgi:hypothetical protein
LYGLGDTPEEAAGMLRREIPSLHQDLLEDDNFSPEFLAMKERFSGMGIEPGSLPSDYCYAISSMASAFSDWEREFGVVYTITQGD